MNLLSRIKWAWQRVYRGWDDRIIWAVDIYLTRMLPIWLKALKDDKMGVPASLCTKSVEEGTVIWDEILDKIIKGFIAAQRITERDFPIMSDLEELEKSRYGKMLLPWVEEDVNRLNQLYKELSFRDKFKQQEDAAYEEFQEGMNLFTEHFFNLWS